MQFTLKRKSEEASSEGVKSHFEAAIIGAGPAGLTATIYLGRSKIDTVIFEKMVPGGYIVSTDWIENYPGFPDGISGEELGELFEKQSSKFGVRTENVEVIGVDFEARPMIVETMDGSYTASAIIVATGTKSKKLGVPGEEELIGKGISLCATCDAPFFEGEDIVVVGAGNSGIQESLYLSKFARSIRIIEFLDHPTAERILLDRIKEIGKIELLLSHRVTRFIGDDRLTQVEVEKRDFNQKRVLDVKGAFIYVGLAPNTGFLKGSIDMDKEGFIKTNQELKSSKEGVFAAGDVRITPLRQVATAVGDGALAAFKVRQYLEGR